MKRLCKKCLLPLCILFLALLLPEHAYADALQAEGYAVSGSTAELKWNAVPEADSYHIYRRLPQDAGFVKLASLPGTVYRDTIRAAVAYTYKIVPIEIGTGREMTEAEAVVALKAPAETAIERIQVKSPTKLRLYWRIAAGSSGYQILRSEDAGATYEEIARVTGSSARAYTDTQVVPGRIYYYRVCPLSQGGKGFGTPSAPKKARTIAQPVITSVASLSSDKIQIAWKKAGGANAYEVYRSTQAGGGYRKVATLNASARRYIDRTVKSGKKYHYRLVSIGMFNGERITSGYSEPASFRVLRQVRILSVRATDQDGLQIKWGRVTGATKYKIFRSASKTIGFREIAMTEASPAPSYTDMQVVSGKTYYYKVQAYSDGQGIISEGSGTKSESKGGTTAYAIMGESLVDTEQMAALFHASGKKFPDAIYQEKGAASIEEFCEIVFAESEAEGVRAEVIFAQICLETGYLQFGGQVSAQQCNFSGLGATDDGAAGATFADVETGIRAQVQHLKGYASREGLNQECVDPRFIYLAARRGTARYVQSLGNGNWATDPAYAVKLMNLIKAMKRY